MILGVEGVSVEGAAVGTGVVVASPPPQAATSKLVNIKKTTIFNRIYTSLSL
jgi:hypothetical protein